MKSMIIGFGEGEDVILFLKTILKEFLSQDLKGLITEQQ